MCVMTTAILGQWVNQQRAQLLSVGSFAGRREEQKVGSWYSAPYSKTRGRWLWTECFHKERRGGGCLCRSIAICDQAHYQQSKWEENYKLLVSYNRSTTIWASQSGTQPRSMDKKSNSADGLGWTRKMTMTVIPESGLPFWTAFPFLLLTNSNNFMLAEWTGSRGAIVCGLTRHSLDIYISPPPTKPSRFQSRWMGKQANNLVQAKTSHGNWGRSH